MTLDSERVKKAREIIVEKRKDIAEELSSPFALGDLIFFVQAILGENTPNDREITMAVHELLDSEEGRYIPILLWLADRRLKFNPKHRLNKTEIT